MKKTLAAAALGLALPAAAAAQFLAPAAVPVPASPSLALPALRPALPGFPIHRPAELPSPLIPGRIGLPSPAAPRIRLPAQAPLRLPARLPAPELPAVRPLRDLPGSELPGIPLVTRLKGTAPAAAGALFDGGRAGAPAVRAPALRSLPAPR